MKKLSNILLLIICLVGLASCNEDNGNYNYLDYSQIGELKIDTIGIKNRNVLSILNPGDTVVLEPNVTYPHAENLRYRWFVHKYPYTTVTVGNTQKYQAADTISTSKKLNWIVNLAAGTYTFYFMAEDSVTGQKAFFKFQEQYGTVNATGTKSGLYLLTEYDGQTDIDIYQSQLALIMGGDGLYKHYYSKLHGMISGKPKFISYGSSWYYVFTDETGVRLNVKGLDKMDDWSSMFYSAPVYNPQSMVYVGYPSYCECLINNGKLHVLYPKKTSSRKLSSPVAGNYTASSFITETCRYSKGSADCVIYDKASHAFRPYFAQGTSVSNFMNYTGTTGFDVSNMPADPVASFRGSGNATYSILHIDGQAWLYTSLFYNKADVGNYTLGVSKPIISLAECTDIMNAQYYIGSNGGSAFFYTTPRGVYSFSPISGSTTSNTIYSCSAGEEVTSMYIMPSVGIPTGGCILWVAIYNAGTKQGTLREYEIDPNAGVPRTEYLPMFAPTHSNPQVTTGLGKIVSMTIKL